MPLDIFFIPSISYGWCHQPFQVVTFNDMMEMLTDYDYTIDVTSDAAGAAETYGVEAGYGIISAQKMCLWVAQNCPQACPSEYATLDSPF